MNEFREAQMQYENTPIPMELEDCVRKGISQGRASYRRKILKKWFSTAAACFALLMAALNLSAPVAAAAAEIPIMGGLFEVLTIRNFSDVNDDRAVEVNQPAIIGNSFAERINQEIQLRVDAKIKEGEDVVARTKEAFLATGGTEEQWRKRDTTVSVDYEIKSQTDTTVSFVIDSYVSVASAYHEQFYYNLDLSAEKELTLADVLGEHWVEICNESIRRQMAGSADPSVYFDESMGGFATVDEDTSFYIDADGNAVVVFPRGAVAIGAMGIVEFVCTVAEGRLGTLTNLS